MNFAQHVFNEVNPGNRFLEEMNRVVPWELFKTMSDFTVKLGERKLPMGKYGVVLASGLFMGWLEGVMAKKIAQHPASEP